MRTMMMMSRRTTLGLWLLVGTGYYDVSVGFQYQPSSVRRRSPSRSLHTSTISTIVATKQATEAAIDSSNTRSFDIVRSFVPNDYEPVSWLTNKHVQTIGGYLLRGIPECEYVSTDVSRVVPELFQGLTRTIGSNHNKRNFQWDHRERFETPDGDWFHADYKYAAVDRDGSSPLVIMLHGLEASSDSGLSMEMAESFRRQGMNVVCLNFRGCTGVPNDTLGAYHAGFTHDLLHYLDMMSRRQTNRQVPVYLSGFSLGANVVLKALGDLGEEARTEYNIQGAAVGCAPLDCERNIRYLDAAGFNRAVYSDSFLRSAREKAKVQLEKFCNGDEMTDRFDFPRAVSAKTIAEFDNAYIAPIYGFDSNIDYYRKVSSAHVLDKIAVPTLILNAGDDPFFDPTFFPKEGVSCEHGGPAPLKMVRTKYGGHLGFAFHQVEDELELQRAREEQRPSWAPWELSRFLHHVHTQVEQDR